MVFNSTEFFEELSDKAEIVALSELIETGLLQEINRLLLHPAGYCLGISKGDDLQPDTFILLRRKKESGPGGFAFKQKDISIDKIRSVRKLTEDNVKGRLEQFNFILQEIISSED